MASTPDALRYVLHARRFGRELPRDELRGQARVRAHAMRRSSDGVDPFELAKVEHWIHDVDAAAAAAGAQADPAEPTHA